MISLEKRYIGVIQDEVTTEDTQQLPDVTACDFMCITETKPEKKQDIYLTCQSDL